MNHTVAKRIRSVILIVCCIVGVTILFSFLQYLLYDKNNPHASRIEWQGEGRLLFEGGSEYSETIPVKVDGFYFDYGMFYKDKNYLSLDLELDGKEEFFYCGYYYMADMREVLFDVAGEDGTTIKKEEDYICRLAYADYARKESWTLVFYIDDVSGITQKGEKGQKGLLIVTDQESQTPADAVEKAIQKWESLNREDPDIIWEKYITQN